MIVKLSIKICTYIILHSKAQTEGTRTKHFWLERDVLLKDLIKITRPVFHLIHPDITFTWNMRNLVVHILVYIIVPTELPQQLRLNTVWFLTVWPLLHVPLTTGFSFEIKSDLSFYTCSQTRLDLFLHLSWEVKGTIQFMVSIEEVRFSACIAIVTSFIIIFLVSLLLCNLYCLHTCTQTQKIIRNSDKGSYSILVSISVFQLAYTAFSNP